MLFARRLRRVFPQLDELEVADLGDHIYLNKITVNPKWRGRGIGSKVVGEVQRYAKNRGLPLVLRRAAENAERLKKFYGRLGFRGTENRFRYHGGNQAMQSKSGS